MKNRKKTAALSREFQNFLTDIENLLQEAALLSGEEFALARAKIQERVMEAKASVVNLSEQLSGKACKAVKTANNDVHEEPWKAIGTGAAVGLLLGLMFSRR